MLQSQKDRAPGKARPKTPPKMGPSMERAKEASAAAVMEAVLSIAADSASVLLGSPEDPGLTFDQIFDWHGDHTGVPYRSRGSRTFEEYLRAAFWDQVAVLVIATRDGRVLLKHQVLNHCSMQSKGCMRTLTTIVWCLAIANSLALAWGTYDATLDSMSVGGPSTRVRMNMQDQGRSQGA